MKRILITYWPSSGRTEAMARALAEGARSAGTLVLVSPVSRVRPRDLLDFDAVALGCPAVAIQGQDESPMTRFFADLGTPELRGKPVALFGSEDWCDGDWMREWQRRTEALGARLVTRGLVCVDEPEDPQLDRCRSAGRSLAA